MPASHRCTWTVQFWCKDVQLWHQQQLLPHDAPLATLITADLVTLYIDNQKNGHQGDTIHHTAAPRPLCPVKALAQQDHAVCTLDANELTPISLYAPHQHITMAAIVNTVHLMAMPCSGLGHIPSMPPGPWPSN